ncbi:hypothetical protein BAU15_00740 [Enterococcus sp. JM4C]|uniref:AraC family transcriptional regulator n=1 Tax=Candidatus Enterococcus huntleyi TaxID=1857217 RepID=UPI00137ACD34|nr:AraC family transcriptional regulator [Enterococcus sp. JM4C]KAF1299206.1 hypothetical protein BAU15_00740 [Enterococcus sp. JM4C]
MEKRKLDDYLFEISAAEAVVDNDAHYKSLKKRRINGELVYIFDQLIPPQKKIHITKHARFAEVPTHIHTFIEINYVYSGTCTQIIDGEKIVLRTGEIIIIDTKTPHSVLYADKDDIIINILLRKDYFTNAFFTKIQDNGIISDFLLRSISYTQEHDQYIIFHSNENTHIEIIMSMLLWEWFFPALGSSSLIDNYLIILFIELVRIFQYETNQKSNNFSGQIEFSKIVTYMEENFLNCSLPEMAKNFNYSTNYLSALIKKNTGNTYSNLLLELKLNHAKFLLENTNDSINTIAMNSGFKNMTYFYKKYKERYSCTPKKTRSYDSSFL